MLVTLVQAILLEELAVEAALGTEEEILEITDSLVLVEQVQTLVHLGLFKQAAAEVAEV